MDKQLAQAKVLLRQMRQTVEDIEDARTIGRGKKAHGHKPRLPWTETLAKSAALVFPTERTCGGTLDPDDELFELKAIDRRRKIGGSKSRQTSTVRSQRGWKPQDLSPIFVLASPCGWRSGWWRRNCGSAGGRNRI